MEGPFHIQVHFTDRSDRHVSSEEEDVTSGEAVLKSEEIEREAKQRADAILKEARDEAGRIRAEAKAAIDAWWQEQRAEDEQYKESIRRQAYDEGYQQGYEKGMAKAEEEATEQLNDARRIVEEAYTAKEQIITEAEPFLVDLSVHIAEKVITQQLELKPEVIVNIVQRALEHCHEAGMITVLVKPEHFSLVQQAREELKQSLSGPIELQILPDHTLETDGCVIRSQHGRVDARIDVQLDQIQKALAEVAREGEGQVDVSHSEVS